MKSQQILSVVALLFAAVEAREIPFGSLSLGMPIKREVPQEHSHEATLRTVRTLLQKNNPDKIADPVFGLLGNAAAAGGKGNIADVNCLQQATADQAFTNAKAANDIPGMTAALIFRTLERNTQGIGTQSAPCTSIQAKNPEIAALKQHQDPASDGAAATNKQIALDLAVQIAKIGGNPQDAIQSGTFSPGSKTDFSGKGNTCDDANDAKGCIISQNLLVPDVTAAEINAAVGAGGAGGAGGAKGNPPATTKPAAANPPAATKTAAANPPATPACGGGAAPPANKGTAKPAAGNAAGAGAAVAGGANLQKFTGALGGIAASAVVDSGNADRPFKVVADGSTDVNLKAALQRSCDIQHNACANAANSGKLAGGVGQCETQQQACVAA